MTTRLLRKRMDHYLLELEEKEGTDPGLQLVPSAQSKVKVRARR